MSIFKKLGDEIADLAELNVQTFTGDISTVIQKDGGNIIDWQALLATAKNTQGNVKLVASSVVYFDGDSNTFYDQNISDTMRLSHETSVKAGQNVRIALCDMFKELLGLNSAPK